MSAPHSDVEIKYVSGDGWYLRYQGAEYHALQTHPWFMRGAPRAPEPVKAAWNAFIHHPSSGGASPSRYVSVASLMRSKLSIPAG